MTTNLIHTDNKTSDVTETLSIVLENKGEFIIQRIPDVPYPSFFILSAAVVIFYVTIRDRLKLFVVMESQRNPKPCITSTTFDSKKITFKCGKEKEGLGCCLAKEKVAWDLTKGDKSGEKLFEIMSRSDGLSCRIVEKNNGEVKGEMKWEPYWTVSDLQLLNTTHHLPSNASYNLKLDPNLEPRLKTLILVSSLAVHYGQKQLTPKKCTKKTILLITLAMSFLLLTSVPLIIYII